MTQPVGAADVVAQKIEWRWPLPDSGFEGRIPKGMITVVAGKRDQGKGLFAAHVAAEVSASGENVLYCALEDSHSLMTRPRLEAAGADLNRISLWRFRLPSQANELDEIVRKRNIGLVVIDPFGRCLDRGISRYGDNVEVVLAPLQKVVEDTGASALVVEHVLKRPPKSGDPLDSIGGGSSGLAAAARAAWILGLDPDDHDRRILGQAKLNISTRRAAMAFELDVEEVSLVTKDDEVFVEDTPYLLVDEELEAFDVMRLFETNRGAPSDKRAAAAEWLTTQLAENGPMSQSDLVEDAKQYNMSRRTLERAAADMGIVKGKGRGSKWDLPDDVKKLMGMTPTVPPPDKKGPVDAADVTVTDEALAEFLGGDKNE